MAQWVDIELDERLEVGRYYVMEFKVPFSTNEAAENVIRATLNGAAVTQHAIRFTGIEFIPQFLQDKRDGTLLRLRFQAIPNDAIYEAGFSPRVILGAIGGVLLLFLTASGTLKRFAILTDDVVQNVGKAFDPATLIGIALILMLVLPALRKG